MSFYLYLILGFLGGIPAGMGMGGGTVTIPLLVLLAGVPQKIAQSANLFAFLPMSALALRTHSQNGLVQKEGVLPVVLGALVSSFGGALLAAGLTSEVLGKAFGAFLIALAIATFRATFRAKNA